MSNARQVEAAGGCRKAMATRGLQNGLQGNRGSPAQRRGHGRGCGAACAGLAEPGGRPPSLGDTDYTTSCEITPIWAWSRRPRRHDVVPYWQGGGAGMAGTGGREGRPSCQLAAWPKSQAGVSKRLRVKKHQQFPGFLTPAVAFARGGGAPRRAQALGGK
jgi:hypothetical protein